MILSGDDARKPPGPDKPKLIIPGQEKQERATPPRGPAPLHDSAPPRDTAAARDPAPSSSERVRADESWKEKAQREKEKLAQAEKERGEEPPRDLPPASFLSVVEDFAVRAMLALGQIRDPGTGQVYIDIEGAKYMVDLLEVLEKKTKGNLEANEEAALKEVLHNLRLTWVRVSKALQAAALAQKEQALRSGADPDAPTPPGPKIVY